MAWIPSKGIFRYGPGVRAVVEADEGIASTYRALIPKYIRHNPPRYPAHISVVRHEQPLNMEAWLKHEGEEIEFEYEDVHVWDELYMWLNVRCPRVEEIRTELGLAPYPWWRNGYHLTIANFKDV